MMQDLNASAGKASKRQLAEWRKLQQKKYRAESGFFLAEGERCVRQILQNRRLSVESVLFSGSGLSVSAPPDTGIYELGEDEFAAITGTENPQGIAAVCRIPKEISLSDLGAGDGLVVAADAVQDPGNLGTMIRTASWFGAKAFLCGTGTVDPYNPKVVRSTAGSTGSVPVLSGDLNGIFLRLEEREWEVLLLDGGKEPAALKTVEKPVKTILVVGNEANGVDSMLFAPHRIRAGIEGRSDVIESLNAAVALGIALYELQR